TTARSASESLLQLRLRERGLRLGPLCVLDRVDERDLIAARRRDRPELIDRRDRGARDLGEALLQLLGLDPELFRDLLVSRRAVELRLQLGDRPLDVTRPRS